MAKPGPDPPARSAGLLAVSGRPARRAAVEGSFRNGIDQSERGHHGAGGKHLDLEVAAGHVVDQLGVVQRVSWNMFLRRHVLCHRC